LFVIDIVNITLLFDMGQLLSNYFQKVINNLHLVSCVCLYHHQHYYTNIHKIFDIKKLF